MNPYLLAIMIGLTVLDVTCFIGLKVSLPKPVSIGAPIPVPITA
jgi:hypothetical protein